MRAMEHVTEGSWETLPVPLHPRVLGVLRDLGFPYMTPVQVLGAAQGTRGRPAQGADGERQAQSRPGTRRTGRGRSALALALASRSSHPSSGDFCHVSRLPGLGRCQAASDSGRQRRLAAAHLCRGPRAAAHLRLWVLGFKCLVHSLAHPL